MRKPSIAIKLTPQNYAGLINLGNRVAASLPGNLNFSTPAVTVANLLVAVTAVENAYAVWAPIGSRGSASDLLDLRNKSLTLWQLLKAEAQYVETTAQIAAGSNYADMAAIISTSGYDLAAVPSPQGVLEMVQGLHRFVSRQLAVNQLKLKWAKPLNVTSGNNVKDYHVMRAATADFATAVEIAATTRTFFVDTNNTNTPQTWTYWIVPFNSVGPGVPSDAVTVTVLNA